MSESDIAEGYAWLLGRPANAADIAFWTGHFAGRPGDQRAAFHDELICSAEFRQRQLRVHQWRRLAEVELDRPRLAFVHLEKCGGTTLRAMLETQFPAGRICPERHDGLGHWTINELAAYDLFAGHFDLALCRCIPGRVRTVTMLREPRARLRSLYRFWKSHLPHPERDKHDLMALVRALPEAAFFAHPEVRHHPSIRNAMAAQLTRTGHRDTLRPADRLVADPQGSLARAWESLRRMDCYGIMERFEDSRLMLNARLGLAMPALAPRQVLAELVAGSPDMVEVAQAQASPQLDAALDGLTDVDRPLYAMAKRLFGERLRHIGLPA